ncbi:unnamed protein product [Mucor hiemalis]
MNRVDDNLPSATSSVLSDLEDIEMEDINEETQLMSNIDFINGDDDLDPLLEDLGNSDPNTTTFTGTQDDGINRQTINSAPKNFSNQDHKNLVDEKTDNELIEMFKMKIKRLQIDQLDLKSINEIEKNNQFIKQYNITLNQLQGHNNEDNNNNQTAVKKNNSNNIDEIKKINIPCFQLVDDPPNT